MTAALESDAENVFGKPQQDERNLAAFRERVLEQGRALYRDLPWRRTRDPYAIWISEVMLQQTQVSRVDGRWQRWLDRFPTVDALAAADSADVLEEWQGLGYNRRALALSRAARAVSASGGQMPVEEPALRALPGIGAATAAGIRAFAYDLPGVYLETNVRTVFLHELYPAAEGVPDAELVPLVRKTCPKDASNPQDDPRSWYYALLDYGAHLKATVPNPSRRSRSHARQSRFEGSHRQKRAELVRVLLAHRSEPAGGASFDVLLEELCNEELAAGRNPLTASEVADLLAELSAEGFCYKAGNIWRV
ncbi:MAG: adenine glycosylase [Tractidigestivibacter sp.]|uniref:adenine glycosylase n=1 Tax=Tractidigestivibacter sp. TaxID=2847320 RepID=UPI003D942D17